MNSLQDNLGLPGLIPAEKGPPFDLLRRWRESGDSVHWNPAPAAENYIVQLNRSSIWGELQQGFWVLTRYKDVVSRNQKLFSSHVGGPVIWDLEREALAFQQAGLMGMAPEQHMKAKRLVTPPFSPKAITEFEPEIGRVAKEIVDSIARRGECEFVFDVASRLPVYTFCTLMGIPDTDREKIFRLGNAMADVENALTEGERLTAESDVAPLDELFAYAAWLAEQKRIMPDNSMMSAYVNGDVDGERLTDAQIGMFFVTMSIAGHETTRSTAAHFIRLMSEHPDQYALLRSDLETYLPNAIDEVLRFSPPVIQFRRTVTLDTVIGDREVKEGDKLYLSYAAANRDPEIFDDPDRFDITRTNAARHLSFGIGPHICLGARVAKLQLQLLLGQIVRRVPDIAPSTKPTFLNSIWFSAIVDMPVQFTAEG
ncbi:hypothetical protein DM806_22565 [Sphingobium lactosutens]|uniref:cytochrome P450 n=1 Tax=Sphingobium lactosutens TaxID=522773 RepID=UPI0015BCBA6A|nr:cytochrome P450 [Sphingobium lactosutens]NWK98399.1 hypothetical protein [Sphingobium lactosutens]